MKAFVIAMDKEAAPILAAAKILKDEKICGRRVMTLSMFGMELGAVICGVGKVNAACGAQLAIDLFGADTIINIGVAGGLHAGLCIAGIYSVCAAVQYDFDLTQLNGTTIGTLDECTESYIPLTTPPLYPEKRLATGDRFNDSESDLRLLTDVLGADIRDMEGGAIAQACMHARVKCCSFKIISDLAGSGSTTEQYLKNLGLCEQALSRELENIIRSV